MVVAGSGCRVAREVMLDAAYTGGVREEVYELYLAMCKVPSVSSDSLHHSHVRSVNKMIADDLAALHLFDSIVDYDYGSPTGPTTLVARRAPQEGRPTIGLYAHSDVQPATAQGWRIEDPFRPERIGERLYGRGVVDDKAGIFGLMASLRLVAEDYRESGCGLVVLVEGEEECGSPRSHNLFSDMAEDLKADEFLVLDAANIDDDTPALTTTIRGNLIVRVDVRTLQRPVHSGGSGGVLPDAVAVGARIIAGLYDDRGVYRVTPDPVGILRHPVPESLSNNVSVPLHGRTRPIELPDPVAASWYSYSATVTGMDVTAIEAASNTLLDTVSFLVSVRIPPGGSAATALEDLSTYLGADNWSGSQVTIVVESQSEPYAADPTTMRARLLRASIARVWGDEPKLIGIGGSIPIVATLSESLPGCETLLFGVGSSSSRAHSTDESLDVGLLDRITLSLAHYLYARIAELNPTRKESEK